MPDASLEGRTPDIKRQIESDSRCFDKTHDRRHELFKLIIPTNQVGLRKCVLYIAYQDIGIVAQKNGAHASIASGNENGPERALAYGKTDVCPSATGAKRAVSAGAIYRP